MKAQFSTHIDSNTLASETTWTTDAMNVIFTVASGCRKVINRHRKRSQAPLRREIIVDNQRDLLNVDAASPYVGSDQNSTEQAKLKWSEQIWNIEELTKFRRGILPW